MERSFMNRTQKAEMVERLKNDLANIPALVLADFRGLGVEAANSLRREFEKENCQYRVVKNTLLRLAIQGTPLEPIKPYLEGPTAIAWSQDDPIAPARVAAKFAKDTKEFQLKGGVVDGKGLTEEGVKALATMPGKNDLRAGILGLMVAVPQQFLGVLEGVPREFLMVLGAREEQLKKAS